MLLSPAKSTACPPAWTSCERDLVEHVPKLAAAASQALMDTLGCQQLPNSTAKVSNLGPNLNLLQADAANPGRPRPGLSLEQPPKRSQEPG